MDKKSNNPKSTRTATLQGISLSYEYDKTYRDIIKQNKSRAQ